MKVLWLILTLAVATPTAADWARAIREVNRRTRVEREAIKAAWPCPDLRWKRVTAPGPEGNQYVSTCRFKEIEQHGSNVRTGSEWVTFYSMNGDQRGTDKRGCRWTYHAPTKYTRGNTWRACS